MRSAPRVALGAALVLGVVLAGGALGLWITANRAIQATAVAGLAPPAPGVTNLLVATAAHDGAPVDGVAVVQLAADREQPAVLVLPAALELAVPDTGEVTLARAPDVGGMALLVEQVAQYTGMDLHHYVRVDRRALAGLVDRSGGLDDCPAQDVDACPRLIGDQVRTRLASEGNTVTDAQRVVAHLDVAQVLASELHRPRTALDPRRAVRWSRAWDAVLTTDVDPGVAGARALAEQVAQLDPHDLDVRILPGVVADGSVTVEPESAAVLLGAFTQVAALPADVGLEAPRAPVPQDVTVRVLNGVGRAGVAGAVADGLREEGFEVADVDNALRFDERAPTTIGHGPGGLPMARLVAEQLPDAEVVDSDDLPDGIDVVVVVGRGGTS